jgi:hypothetical protein
VVEVDWEATKLKVVVRFTIACGERFFWHGKSLGESEPGILPSQNARYMQDKSYAPSGATTAALAL